MVNAGRMDLGAAGEVLRPDLKHGAAATFDFFASLGQIGEKAAHLFSHGSTSTQALVGRCCLARPAPDGLIGVEVRTVAGQSRPVLDTGCTRRRFRLGVVR